MPPDRAGIASSHMTIVAVTRNLNAQLLCYFEFQLLQRLICLRYDKIIGSAGTCSHVVHLLVVGDSIMLGTEEAETGIVW